MGSKIWRAAAAAAWAFIVVNAHAATNAWTSLGPEGGSIVRVVYSPTPGTVFLIATGGFYRSQDGGVSWQLIYSGFFNAAWDLAIDPADASRVYVIAPNSPSLYVSTDGGATLSPSATFPSSVQNAEAIAVSHDGMTLYVTAQNQLYRSTDRGQTWTERTPFLSTSTIVLRVLVDPTDSNTLYVVQANSGTVTFILVTHDGGKSWAQLSAGATGIPRDVAINPANPQQLWVARDDGVWMTADRGTTWSQVLSTGIEALAVDPTNPAVLYAGTGDGQEYRSADSGTSWSDVSGGMNAGEVRSIAVNPAADAQLLTGGDGGLVGSSNSGGSWTTQQTGLMSTHIANLVSDPSTGRIYMNDEAGGIFYTTGASGTITPVNNQQLRDFQTGMIVGEPNSFVVTGLSAEPGLLAISIFDGLALSTDGGNNFTLTQPLSGGSQQLFSLAGNPATPQTLLATALDGLYRTTNPSQPWDLVTAGIPTGAVFGSVYIAPSDPTVAYGMLYQQPAGATTVTYLGVYRSSDGGMTWQAAGQIGGTGVPQSLSAVDPQNPKVLYGTTDTTPSLYKSSDAGSTWTLLSSTYAGSVLVDPVHTNIIYASTFYGLGRSVDGGVSWQALPNSNSTVTAPASLILDPLQPANVFLGTMAAGLEVLTVAPDLAVSTTTVAGSSAVGVSSNYAFTATNSGPYDATGVTVTLQLPATAQNLTATAGGTTCSVSGVLATCAIGVLRVNSPVTVTLSATGSAAGPFPIVATIAGDQPDSNSANNSLTLSASVAVMADLSVTATGSATATIGDPVNYTLSVNDAGPDAAPATQLTFQLASGLTFVSASSTGGTCTPGASSQINCSLNAVNVGKPVTVTIGATAATAGNQTSTATVSTSATDPVSTNNSSSVKMVINAPATIAESAPSKSGGGILSPWDLVGLMLLWVPYAWRARSPRAA